MKFVQILLHYLRNLPFLSFKLWGFLHVSAKFIKSLTLSLHCYSVLYMFLNKILRIILQACFWIELLYNSISECMCSILIFLLVLLYYIFMHLLRTLSYHWKCDDWGLRETVFFLIHLKKFFSAYILQRNGDSLVDYPFPILFNCYKSYYCAYVSLILAWVFEGNSAIPEEHLNTDTCYKCLFFFSRLFTNYLCRRLQG